MGQTLKTQRGTKKHGLLGLLLKKILKSLHNCTESYFGAKNLTLNFKYLKSTRLGHPLF